MAAFLEATIDKFTFRVDTTCLYSPEGIWVRFESGRARLGLSDFLQQRSGDVAFVDVKPAGTTLAPDDEFGSIETVKANVMLASPLSGTIVQINPALECKPEIINQDPFGEGWLCEIFTSSWDADCLQLLEANAYFEKMKREAEEAR